MRSKAYYRMTRFGDTVDDMVMEYRVEDYDIPFFRHFWVKIIHRIDPCRLPHRKWYGWVWERLYDMEMRADQTQRDFRVKTTKVSEDWARENFDWDIDRDLFGDVDD